MAITADRDRPIVAIILWSAAIVMLGVGAKLALDDEATSATSCFAAGILLIAFALLSKFKRIKGPWFEAEMWDQEQLKAEMLVGKLEKLSNITIQQLALFAANLGLISGNLTISQKEQLLSQLENLLSEFGRSDSTEYRALLPLMDRIFYDYCWSIDGDIRERIRTIMEECSDDISSPRYNAAVHELDLLAQLKTKTRQLDRQYIDKIKGFVSKSMFIDAEKSEIFANIRSCEEKIEMLLEKRAKIRGSM